VFHLQSMPEHVQCESSVCDRNSSCRNACAARARRDGVKTPFTTSVREVDVAPALGSSLTNRTRHVGNSPKVCGGWAHFNNRRRLNGT